MTEFKITEGEGKRYLLSAYHQLSHLIFTPHKRYWQPHFTETKQAGKGSILCPRPQSGFTTEPGFEPWHASLQSSCYPLCTALPASQQLQVQLSQVWTNEIYCTAQTWLHLRTGECVGRGTCIMCAWTKLVIHKSKKRPGPIPGYETLCHSLLPQRTLTQNSLPVFYLHSSCLKDPSLLLDLPHHCHFFQH